MIFVRTLPGRESLNRELLQSVIECCQEADVVGISLMSQYFLQAKALTVELKKTFKKPVIWGGIHPTVRPEECLEFADGVCLGEGEWSFLELINKIQNNEEYTDTAGFWFRCGDEVVKNGLYPLEENLDNLPDPDYEIESQLIRQGNEIVPLTNEIFEACLPKRVLGNKMVTEFYIAGSRGCPYHCAYCTSPTLNNFYPGQKYFRLRKIEDVVDEARYLKNHFSFIGNIYFSDDDIFACPPGRLETFARLWKEKVNLLFICTFMPFSYSEERLKLVKEAGAVIVNMGIQSVSQKGMEVFDRHVPKEKLLSVIKSVDEVKMPLPPVYDFILDNPYESLDDKLENLNFILSLPKNIDIKTFSLTPFPGTSIYERYKRDGILKSDTKDIYSTAYSEIEKSYINFLYDLVVANFPRWLIKLAAGKRIVLLMGKYLPESAIGKLKNFITYYQGIKSLARGELYKIGYHKVLKNFYSS